jgi:hypothetical protein
LRRAVLASILSALSLAVASCFARPRGATERTGSTEPIPPALPSRVAVAEAPGRAFSVAIRVEEAAGVARRSAPCLASVPLPREAGIVAGSELSLTTDGGLPVPCQATVLSRYDGKLADESKLARWVLVAFECDLGAHRIGTFRLVRRRNEWPPTAPASVQAGEDGRALLRTGAIEAHLGGRALIESIERSGKVLARGLQAYVRAGAAEAETSAAPSLEVLEPGPVRAVVRLTGKLSKELDYALTVEGWAGRAELALSLETRNSDRCAVHTVRLSELGLALDLPALVERVVTPEGDRGLTEHDALLLDQLAPAKKNGAPRFELGLEGGARLAEGVAHEGWLAAGNAKALAGVATRKPLARAPFGVRVARDRLLLRFVTPAREGEEGPLRYRWLADLQHRTDDALLFFGARGAAEAHDLVLSYRSRLQGAPSAEWVRDTGGFFGPFADEADERAAYAACGVDLPARPKSDLAARPEAEIGDLNVKWDTETDDARDLFSQWLRTGERSAFDEGCAWAEFYRDRYTPRTDGFTFSDAKLRPSDDAGEVVKVAKTLEAARWKESHIYGEGLVAHYLLTGDRASLEAARDLAGVVEKVLPDVGPDYKIYEVRCFARPFQVLCALAEVTGEERYREAVSRFVAAAFSGPTRDRALGCYAIMMYVGDFDLDKVLPAGLSLPERFPGDAARGLFRNGPRQLHIKSERACWPYQDRELAHALARAFETTGDERARQALLGLADYYLDQGLIPCFHEPALAITPYFTLPYVPEPDVARYEQPSCPLYSTNLGLTEAAAYLVSGDRRFLDLAKRCLRIAALRGHGDLRPIGDERPIRIPTTVQWAHGWDDERTFHAVGAGASRFEAPPPPRDLLVRRGARAGTVEVSFTPGDGKAVRWIVQGAPGPIVDRHPATGETSVFSAEPLLVVPTGGRAKGRVLLTVPARDELRSFVVRAESAAGVLGAMGTCASLGP